MSPKRCSAGLARRTCSSKVGQPARCGAGDFSPLRSQTPKGGPCVTTMSVPAGMSDHGGLDPSATVKADIVCPEKKAPCAGEPQMRSGPTRTASFSSSISPGHPSRRARRALAAATPGLDLAVPSSFRKRQPSRPRYSSSKVTSWLPATSTLCVAGCSESQAAKSATSLCSPALVKSPQCTSKSHGGTTMLPWRPCVSEMATILKAPVVVPPAGRSSTARGAKANGFVAVSGRLGNTASLNTRFLLVTVRGIASKLNQIPTRRQHAMRSLFRMRMAMADSFGFEESAMLHKAHKSAADSTAVPPACGT
mmetsp:Transcript_70522/g.204418  ORF Transcript_70522/g.204418 Transcript_70522/m.204418 type:complete len:308 (+) Transcript_70522:13-936(+)